MTSPGGPGAGPPPCTVQYHKWNGATHWRHETVRLGQDKHGVWLGAPVGTILQRGSEPAISAPFAFVQLIRPDDPWTVLYNAPGGKYEVYVDLTTSADWTEPDRVEMIDLDLDVVRRFDGTISLLDEDEWAEHRVLFDYPTDVVTQVEAAANRLLEMVTAREEPFGAAPARWLRHVT